MAAHFTTKFHAEIVKKGQDATLSCQAFGERPLNIVWTKDRQELNAKLLNRYSYPNITTIYQALNLTDNK